MKHDPTDDSLNTRSLSTSNIQDSHRILRGVHLPSVVPEQALPGIDARSRCRHSPPVRLGLRHDDADHQTARGSGLIKPIGMPSKLVIR